MSNSEYDASIRGMQSRCCEVASAGERKLERLLRPARCHFCNESLYYADDERYEPEVQVTVDTRGERDGIQNFYAHLRCWDANMAVKKKDNMDMSMRIIGFRQPNDEWQLMKAAWDACRNAGVTIPPGVVKFFGGQAPGESPGEAVDIDIASQHQKVSDGECRGLDIWDVDLSKLPSGVKVLRFSYSH